MKKQGARNSRYVAAMKKSEPSIRERLAIWHEANAGGHSGQEVSSEDASLFFSMANVQLFSLVNLATIYEQAVENEKLPPEIAAIFRDFSDRLHSIAFCLDDDLSTFARVAGFTWWPVYEYEDELTASVGKEPVNVNGLIAK